MPTPRKYPTSAERQAAYRRRCSLRNSQYQQSTPPVHYRTMKANLMRLLQTASSQLTSYTGQRSEAWQESERAEQLSEIADSLQEVAAALAEL
jgi:hypothetical protein